MSRQPRLGALDALNAMAQITKRLSRQERPRKLLQSPCATWPRVKIPIPTKIGYNGWCTYPNMVPLVLPHSHIISSIDAFDEALNLLLAVRQEGTIQRQIQMVSPLPPLSSLAAWCLCARTWTSFACVTRSFCGSSGSVLGSGNDRSAKLQQGLPTRKGTMYT